MATAKLEELRLRVKRGKWRVEDLHSSRADERFAAVRQKVLARDRYACRHCGFKSSKYQEVHHLDDDHSNNAESNLLTVCPLCHSVHHIGFSGGRGAVLIWWPEITQADFNNLLRTIWVAIASGDGKIASKAKNLLSLIEHRRQAVVGYLGTDSPVDVANALMSMSEEQMSSADATLSGVRLMCSAAAHEDAIGHWVNEVYKELTPQSWERMVAGNP